MRKVFFSVPILFLAFSCYAPQRDCKAFTDGKFSFTTVIDGEEVTTTFLRSGDLEIDYFQGKADSSSVRWINDCEYIVRKLSPKNKSEEQAVHMKILSTTDNSYTFEYNMVGASKKSKGTAIKID
ncbi:DNA topoisomerase IV [Flavobacteriaceae bacterium TP-CH-4]|uniref:DNA topoisomerase IV n=2 Tax=Pelagihabitans pacificus TaxID=2696054 RepID=A0A967E672_9FLAO|nr:DNA topoisomerase IV [Pelagihabitans pacificus]